MCAACLMHSSDAEAIENYLVEVVDRLVDTEAALQATIMYCKSRKELLISGGKRFDYDVGRIDTCDEILSFVRGESSMREIMDLVKEEKTKIKPIKEGMDVV